MDSSFASSVLSLVKIRYELMVISVLVRQSLSHGLFDLLVAHSALVEKWARNSRNKSSYRLMPWGSERYFKGSSLHQKERFVQIKKIN